MFFFQLEYGISKSVNIALAVQIDDFKMIKTQYVAQKKCSKTYILDGTSNYISIVVTLTYQYFNKYEINNMLYIST